MNKLNRYVMFHLDDQKFALRLFDVEKAVRAVEITPLPKAPEIVLGVVNMQGRVIPVINIRKRFSLPERNLDLTDQFIVMQTTERTLALVADAVSSVFTCPEQAVIPAENIFPGIEYVEAVVKHEDGIIHVLNPDQFLSFAEDKTLAAVLEIMPEEDK